MTSRTPTPTPRRLQDVQPHRRLALRGSQVLASTVLLTLLGPFGTYTDLDAGTRFIYWGLAMLAGFVLVEDMIFRALQVASVRNFPWPASLAGGILVAAVPMTAVVLALEAGFRQPFATDPGSLATLYAYVLSITVLVGGVPIFLELHRHGLLAPVQPVEAPAAVSAPAAAEPARLLDRLPAARRGALLALSMEDHYVRVFTDAGDCLLLLRLSDAMVETGGTPGLRIHRSHWVATAAVTRLERLPDGRLRLHLVNGLVLPVSRSYAKAVREAGFP
ncbi:LytTR family transcriptional regulator [Skermanella mucosa]|uniref:LytTR family DNA-binding domain-containing protein n=1 Tax=Skermanella mucosa TaxID=1789672 RepID=UPI00192BD859|nr:LytTR family DNA-binding domain-containing protein [Skermanella mucosa]UEM20573.1 LytTR family transcriptional regulator [Skermanella mucosa]